VSHLPIDKLDAGKREQALAESVSDLVSRLKLYRPEAIAIVLKKVEPHVRIAVVQADIEPKLYVLPFPGHGHQGKYIEQLETIVKKHAGNVS
jgi:phenylpyruvate tautomerase PptA (4-oxalocrotonate tautomerase family)